MTKKTDRQPTENTPPTCTGCIYIIGRYKARRTGTYKCILSGQITSPHRGACSLREERA